MTKNHFILQTVIKKPSQNAGRSLKNITEGNVTMILMSKTIKSQVMLL